jgi:hypothetical protein
VNLFLSVILEPKYESCGITMRVPKWNNHEFVEFEIANAHQMLRGELLF